jgi:copper chaperone CopZ
MKARDRLGFALIVLLALPAATPWATEPAPSSREEKTTLTIKGMTCGGCVATVKLKLKSTKGVLAYQVSLEKGEADITYDPAETKPEAIAAAVSETGFTARVKKKTAPDRDSGEGDDTPASRARGGSGNSVTVAGGVALPLGSGSHSSCSRRH